MEFRILGPLEVRERERVITLGGAKQRSLLAILLTRGNEVVTQDRLIDEVWGEEPPETAENALQVHVSQLRKALGRDVIQTRPPGYVLEIERDQLDLYRFEELLAQGRQSFDAGRWDQAAETLREALALWRGPALADFAYEPFAQTEIARLEELRLTAVESRIEADMALGRHTECVGELEGLIAKYPLRERLRGQLMLALYRSGRQAEALQAYTDARRVLVGELGIDPSPTLQELEKAVLRQDSGLDFGATRGEPEARQLTPAEVDVPTPERSLLVLPQEDENLDALLSLSKRIARHPPREVILGGIVPDGGDLVAVTRGLQERRTVLQSEGIAARAAAFTSTESGDDAVRLASEQDVDLLLTDAPALLLEGELPGSEVGPILEAAPCDVGILVVRERQVPVFGADRPVLVPFGGEEHDWTAVEIGAWIAGIDGATLRLLGTAADPDAGRRDASRLLASASLMVQQVASVITEPVLVSPGDQEVIAAADDAALVVVGLSSRWSQEGIGETRLAVAKGARPPTLLVKRGLRPGGLAPQESLTRFTWTLAAADRA